MRRVVYCPDDSYIDQATVLAKQNNLPINIGVFDQVKNMTLPTDMVKVLEIPEDINSYFDEKVKQGFHQNIVYINDFIKFDKNLLLFINDVLCNPILIEKHKIIYNIYESTIGNKICKIYYNNEIIESFEYNVY